MMTVYLNKDHNNAIEISSYARELDIPDPSIRFSLNLTFSGDYDPDGVEYLADFANQDITDVEIFDAAGNALLKSFNTIGKLTSLNEFCDENTRSGYASIQLYEVGVTPST